MAGRVVSGTGQAGFFTRLDWVRQQCLQKLGFAPYPGTLNIQVFAEYLPTVAVLQGEAGCSLVPPADNFCTGKVLPVTVGGIRGGLIVPEEEVRVHGASTVEVMAPVGLKKHLGLRDGDAVEFVVHAL